MSTVVRNEKGEPFSKWKPAAKYEHVFAEQRPDIWDQVQKEHQFDNERKWRFDYAWPALLVAAEVIGFGYGHQAQQHMAADNEKLNEAVFQKWWVLRFDSRLLGSKQGVRDAVEQTAALICRL